MKLMSLLGASIAAALFFALPAAAAVGPAFDAGPTVQVVTHDCLVLPMAADAKFFAEADRGCEPTISDLADVCMTETTSAPPARIAVIFLPNEPLGCPTIRPSPPG
ncbi:hypothetical protein [Devosia sediminis]|uniref:Uncharacterized protein n=1 Tax=Devosia sediminis TaxID=2798801 RepID=A0A934MPK3_9HYPH|nr:hypothetical protein [Devosia sediminis]MBJ3783409.1 hypothetical protein [Devosia sediminis]